MNKRFVTIWFRWLITDWFALRKKELKDKPFVVSKPDHGRMIVSAVNQLAERKGITTGITVADARVLIPSLDVVEERAGLAEKLLKGLAEWFIRYTPFVSIDPADGLILDATGCAHLWGSEPAYLKEIVTRMMSLGYHVSLSMADTIGAAWAMVHYGNGEMVVERNQQSSALISLPPEALRIEPQIAEQLHQLGLKRIHFLIGMKHSALRRRFGPLIIQRLNQALGIEEEIIEPVEPISPYQERLPSLEPIITAKGIEIAIQRLLKTLCDRLRKEEKGIRVAVLKCFRADNRIEKIEIGTNHPSCNEKHLFKLFELKIETIEPDMGIELFILEALKVEPLSAFQEMIWQKADGLQNIHLAELIDRFTGKFGATPIRRYLPDEHYWPERSVRSAISIHEKKTTEWKLDRPRPIQLLNNPEHIEVTAPVPDYPPMNFRYKGQLHKIIKADGPERIEQEWWLQQGQHRDYYYVEDEEGKRYWLFRLGHYTDHSYEWFIHGFFV